MSSRPPVMSVKLLSLASPTCSDLQEEAAMVPGITAKPRYFQRKMKDRFFRHGSFLGAGIFFRETSCRLPFMPHRPELHHMHFLNQSLVGGMGLLLDQSGLFLGLRMQSGRPLPRDTWLHGDGWRTSEQNGVYVKREEAGNDIRYTTHSVCYTQCTRKR